MEKKALMTPTQPYYLALRRSHPVMYLSALKNRKKIGPEVHVAKLSDASVTMDESISAWISANPLPSTTTSTSLFDSLNPNSKNSDNKHCHTTSTSTS